jgi:hypothetical protein
LVVVEFLLPLVTAEFPLPLIAVEFLFPLVIVLLPPAAAAEPQQVARICPSGLNAAAETAEPLGLARTTVGDSDAGGVVERPEPEKANGARVAHSAAEAAIRPPTASSTLVVESKKPMMRSMGAPVTIFPALLLLGAH